MRCHSHQVNPAVKDFFWAHEIISSKLQALIRRLSCSIPSAQLHRGTMLRPIIPNPTRWSSDLQISDVLQNSINMLRAFVTVIWKLGCSVKKRKNDLDPILHRIDWLHSVTLQIQVEGTSFSGAHTIFDGFARKYPKMENRLSSHHTLITSPLFECAFDSI